VRVSKRRIQQVALSLLACCLLSGALFPAATSAARFKLGTQLAAQLMREALSRHDNLYFYAGNARRVTCNKRISPIRVRCRMSWFVGDLSFSGKGTIWITFPEHRPFWNYSFRIVRFNEYCAAIEAPDCTKTYVVR